MGEIMKLKTLLIIGLMLSIIFISGCESSFNDCKKECIALKCGLHNINISISDFYKCTNDLNKSIDCFNECKRI